jgi:hypothetical protein
VKPLHNCGSFLAEGKKRRLDGWHRRKNMKNIHSSISSYKTMILRNMIRGLTKCVINKSCV